MWHQALVAQAEPPPELETVAGPKGGGGSTQLNAVLMQEVQDVNRQRALDRRRTRNQRKRRFDRQRARDRFKAEEAASVMTDEQRAVHDRFCAGCVTPIATLREFHRTTTGPPSPSVAPPVDASMSCLDEQAAVSRRLPAHPRAWCAVGHRHLRGRRYELGGRHPELVRAHSAIRPSDEKQMAAARLQWRSVVHTKPPAWWEKHKREEMARTKTSSNEHFTVDLIAGQARVFVGLPTERPCVIGVVCN